MLQFFRTYTDNLFLSQAVRELKKKGQKTPGPEELSQLVRELIAAVPWGHHANVLAKLTDPAARLYYLRATAQFGWSRNVLLNQIKATAYERAVKEKKTHNFDLALPEHLAEQADEMIKSSYNLRFLKALVAFELKVGPFEPEFAGKMDFYLNLLNDKERGPDDQPSIGIITGEFGEGFSKSNLEYMRRFYLAYEDRGVHIAQTASGQSQVDPPHPSIQYGLSGRPERFTGLGRLRFFRCSMCYIGKVFTSKIQALAAMKEIVLSSNKLKRILYGI